MDRMGSADARKMQELSAGSNVGALHSDVHSQSVDHHFAILR